MNELGPVDELYREGLDLFYAGSYSASIEKFDEVLARVPSHQQAQEFRVKAVEAGPDTAQVEDEPATEPAAESSGGGISPLVLVGGLVALLVIGGGIMLLLKSKGKSTKDAPPETAVPVQPAAFSNGVAPEESIPVAAPPVTVGGPEPQPVGSAVNGGAQSTTERQPLGFAAPSPEQSAQASVPSPAVYCAHCGTAGIAGAAFCSSCGRSVADPMGTA